MSGYKLTERSRLVVGWLDPPGTEGNAKMGLGPILEYLKPNNSNFRYYHANVDETPGNSDFIIINSYSCMWFL